VPTREYRFGQCRVRIDRDRLYLETVFPDGAKATATPNHTPADYATAERIGYGRDVVAMWLAHDPLHSWLAALSGLPWSPTLYAVAHGLPATDEHLAEETVVLDFQLFLNTGTVSAALAELLAGCGVSAEGARGRWEKVMEAP
jgi:hypothetical protein